MTVFTLFRVAAFALLALFSLLVLALSAAVISHRNGQTTLSGDPALGIPKIQFNDIFSSAAPGFDLAVSLITLIVVVPSLVFTLLLPKATPRFLSFAWVEIVWVAFLWLLWMIAGAYLQSVPVLPTLGVTIGLDIYALCGSPCAQARALYAFAWLAWLTAFLYLAGLVLAVFVSAKRNNVSFQALEVKQILQDSPTEQMQLGPTAAAEKP